MPVGHMGSGNMFWEEDNIDINIGEGRRSHVDLKSHCFKQRRAIDGRMGLWVENLTIVKGSALIVYKPNTNICLKKIKTQNKRYRNKIINTRTYENKN